ncbi:FG-GAP-like repeat-containing protein [Ekhidna sp.]|uniref:FG-GAP-like repeat-containing protein n=1 Tax=Ekhidna sp. TaxID=2608089 RepID=UPI0032ED63A9
MSKLLTLLLFCPLVIWAQKPFINSISPTHVEVGQTVTISGSNFTGTSNVYFGGIEASSFNVVSNNIIEAIVPAGATNNSIYVFNNSLIAQSSQRFFISFSGSDISSYDAEYTQTTNEQAASDLCMCDLNGDDKNDIIIVHNLQSTDNSQNEVSIYLNNTAGTDAFTGTDFQLTQALNVNTNGSGFFSVTCHDLDNDGDNDLAFSSNLGTNSQDIYVLNNPGTGNFSPASTTSKALPNTSTGDQRLPGSIEAGDMDGDGLTDLIVGNRTDGTFHIFRNTGGLSFANAVELEANGESTGLIKISDFNNDGYLDIVTLPFRQSNSSIHLFKNTSTIGNFNFTFQGTLTNGGQTSDIETGDLNNDGLLEIVVASRNSGRISTFENQSSGGSISFGTASNLTTSGNSAFGVNLGDMNGDGLLDIISSYAAGNVYVFENTFNPSDPDPIISFSTEEIQSTSGISTQNVMVGDLNGDAKPDMAYTHNVQVSQTGNLGIILNRNCVTPILSPSPTDGGVFCQGDIFTLSATFSPGASYTWSVTGTNTNTQALGNTNTQNFQMSNSDNAIIRVTVTSEDGQCTTEFAEHTYIINGSVTSDPTINVSQAGVLCVGDAVTLSTASTYSNYFWTQPDGSTSTTATIDIGSISAADAGNYTLSVQNSGSCSSSEVTQLIEVSSVPSFQILNNGNDDFCDTSTGVILEVPDFTSDYTYQWFLNGSTDLGNTAVSYTATQSGDYTVVITEQAASGCTYTTPAYTVNSISEPVSGVDGPDETCVGYETTFTATSTGQSGFTLTYSWQVDGNPITQTLPDPAQLDTLFTTAGNHTVTLTTAYDPAEVDACSDETVFNVTASDPPTSLTFNEADRVQKCQGDVILIGVTDTGITSYTWSLRNAQDASFLTIPNSTDSLSANFEVPVLSNIDSVYAIVEVMTGINCTVRDSIKVVNYPSTLDIAISDNTTPDVVTLDEANFVNLSAINRDGSMPNITNPRWRPNDIMSDSTSISVTVFPNQPSTIVTLIGTDEDGCAVSSEIEIILNNLRPKRTFSPNGDGMNDCWEILNSSQPNTEDCKVYIFDSRGRNIKVADAPFVDNCVWDGNSGGSPVPEGIYYFVFKCSDSQMSKSGSILLAR